MSVTPPINRLVWVKAGALCAFDGCRKRLVADAMIGDPEAAIGKVAHIVGHSENSGPRSDKPVPGGDRDGIGNLMLLCANHHEVIDRQINTYTVARLVGMKEAHERWVREQLSPTEAETRVACGTEETLHSTLLTVEDMPPTVYTADCDLTENEVKRRIRWPQGENPPMLPYIVRAQKLITFTKLTEHGNAFSEVTSGNPERYRSVEWWADKDHSNWYVSLLNRALNKLTGRRGLNLDRDHDRYYFEPNRSESGKARPRTETYRPLNRSTPESRSVAWQPKRRKTKEPKKHWIHLAVGLRFHRVTEMQWVLSIRPEHRFTKDGYEPLFPRMTGRRATSIKSHMYNMDLLGDLQFWKEYLADGKPHIILDFGGQSLVINAELASAPIKWPGVPNDVKSFRNLLAEDDLFTNAAYYKAIEQNDPDAELEFHELQDLAAMAEDAVGDLP
jgi:hypothetical protein